MRSFIAWTLTMAVGAGAGGTASGQGVAPTPKRGPATTPPAQAPATKATPAAPVDPNAVKAQQLAEEKSRQELNDLLAEWEAQSQKVTSLDVKFSRIDKLGAAWGDVYYQGRAMLKSPDLACLEFTKYKVGDDNKPLKPWQLEREPSERIVCTGEKVLQFEWDEQVIYVYPLDKEVRQKALQQGPLPFLFNMKAAAAKKRYAMSLLKQDDKEYLIGIVPQEEIDRQSFSKAFLWLNKQTFMPNKLRLYPVGEKEQQEFAFTQIVPNGTMDERLFAPSVQIKDWKTIYNPGGDGARPAAQPAAGNAGVAPPRGPVAQPAPKRTVQPPAMRPGGRPQ